MLQNPKQSTSYTCRSTRIDSNRVSVQEAEDVLLASCQSQQKYYRRHVRFPVPAFVFQITASVESFFTLHHIIFSSHMVKKTERHDCVYTETQTGKAGQNQSFHGHHVRHLFPNFSISLALYDMNIRFLVHMNC